VARSILCHAGLLFCVVAKQHLRRILSAYAAYYNQSRTHLALQKDAPLHRAVQRSGVIVASLQGGARSGQAGEQPVREKDLTQVQFKTDGLQ
jgi:hypothetical protein